MLVAIIFCATHKYQIYFKFMHTYFRNMKIAMELPISFELFILYNLKYIHFK